MISFQRRRRCWAGCPGFHPGPLTISALCTSHPASYPPGLGALGQHCGPRGSHSHADPSLVEVQGPTRLSPTPARPYTQTCARNTRCLVSRLPWASVPSANLPLTLLSPLPQAPGLASGLAASRWVSAGHKVPSAPLVRLLSVTGGHTESRKAACGGGPVWQGPTTGPEKGERAKGKGQRAGRSPRGAGWWRPAWSAQVSDGTGRKALSSGIPHTWPLRLGQTQSPWLSSCSSPAPRPCPSALRAKESFRGPCEPEPVPPPPLAGGAGRAQGGSP